MLHELQHLSDVSRLSNKRLLLLINGPHAIQEFLCQIMRSAFLLSGTCRSIDQIIEYQQNATKASSSTVTMHLCMLYAPRVIYVVK